MIAYKLFRVRKDGTLGSLFINRRAVLRRGVPLDAKCHPTKGFKTRPGWHCCPTPSAPHLSINGRAWYKVVMHGVTEERRPASQGGLWYLADRITILEGVAK